MIDIPEDRAFAMGIALNLARRHLSAEQIREIHRQLRKDRELRREVAMKLRQQGKTQAEVASIVGVARKTIDTWEDINNGKNAKANIPDLRIKLSRKQQQKLYERYKSGESQKKLTTAVEIDQEGYNERA